MELVDPDYRVIGDASDLVFLEIRNLPKSKSAGFDCKLNRCLWCRTSAYTAESIIQY